MKFSDKRIRQNLQVLEVLGEFASGSTLAADSSILECKSRFSQQFQEFLLRQESYSDKRLIQCIRSNYMLKVQLRVLATCITESLRLSNSPSFTNLAFNFSTVDDFPVILCWWADPIQCRTEQTWCWVNGINFHTALLQPPDGGIQKPVCGVLLRHPAKGFFQPAN